MDVSVFGLGKLGAPLAAVLAEGGARVIGVDVNEHNVKCINANVAPVKEPLLQETMNRVPFSGGDLTATDDYEYAVNETDFSFIIVPTPSDDSGGFSNSYVVDTVTRIGEVIAEKDSWHLVVVCSTVMPGSIRGEIADALAKSSGKRLHEDYGLAYNPEFIALGEVINGLKYPDMVLIGADDARTAEAVANVVSLFVPEDVPFNFLSTVNAEIAKITLNAFVTMKISFANQLAEACEGIEGADATEVLMAVGTDSRIGSKYLTPGVSYGGPCFPRDSRAFAQFVPISPLAHATDSVNNHQIKRMVDLILKLHIKEGKKVGISGVTYKPGTPVYEESFGYRLIKELDKAKVPVCFFDPLLPQVDFGKDISRAKSLTHLFDSSDVIVLAHSTEGILDQFPKAFENRAYLKFIDCWNVVPDMGPWDINFYRIGRGAI